LQCGRKPDFTNLLTMEKHKFTAEYELRASPRMLFPYFTTPAGLAQWFADDVSVNGGKIYNFTWDGSPHYAKITAQRLNKYVRFEFLDDNQADAADPNFIEFKLDMNEMTQSSFLKVIDYSDLNEAGDLQELWQNLLTSLRETVGG